MTKYEFVSIMNRGCNVLNNRDPLGAYVYSIDGKTGFVYCAKYNKKTGEEIWKLRVYKKFWFNEIDQLLIDLI